MKAFLAALCTCVFLAGFGGTPVLKAAFSGTTVDAPSNSIGHAPYNPETLTHDDVNGDGKIVAGTLDTFAGIDFVYCPPGTFMMGRYPGEQDSNDWEGPQHEVTLTQGFWMSKYEVTQAQWKAVMGSNPSHFQSSSTDNRPVEQVSWNDIAATGGFLEKLNAAYSAYNMYTFRLPTEAEWEFACRAGTTTRYYWDDDPGYSEIWNYALYWFSTVTAGTTLGMLIADVPAVFIGGAMAERLPLKLVRAIAAALFAILGILALTNVGDRFL